LGQTERKSNIDLRKIKTGHENRAVSSAQVFMWYKVSFLDGRKSAEEELLSERPCRSKTEENVTKMRALVMSDRRLTVRMIGSELKLHHRTVPRHFDGGIGHAEDFCKAGSINLANEQRENRRNVCLDLLEHIENEDFFSNMS
jgi:hypothetical protein